MSRKLNLGVVGIGNVWRWGHCEPWLSHPEVAIVGACDIIEERAARFAADHNVPHIFRDYRRMLKLDHLDMVDICTPNLFHSKVAIAALEAGKHVLCEKPDAVSVKEATRMADAARRNKRVLIVIRNNRFRPETQWLRQYIQGGHMGEIYTGRCGWIRRRGIPGKGGWFTTKRLSGGGPLIDLGVHMIDLAVWLMGNPRPIAVTGATYAKFGSSELADSMHSMFGDKKSGGTFDVEDLASGYIRFANGATLQIEFSWASNIENETGFVELRGTKGGFSLGGGDGSLKIFTECQGVLCDVLPRIDKGKLSMHARNINHFVDCVRKRVKPIFTPQQGVDMIKMLCAIYESARSGREVRL